MQYLAITGVNPNAKPYFMKKAATPIHPIVQAFRNLIGKMRQQPDVYPVRYYKKGRRFRRRWEGPLVK